MDGRRRVQPVEKFDIRLVALVEGQGRLAEVTKLLIWKTRLGQRTIKQFSLGGALQEPILPQRTRRNGREDVNPSSKASQARATSSPSSWIVCIAPWCESIKTLSRSLSGNDGPKRRPLWLCGSTGQGSLPGIISEVLAPGMMRSPSRYPDFELVAEHRLQALIHGNRDLFLLFSFSA